MMKVTDPQKMPLFQKNRNLTDWERFRDPKNRVPQQFLLTSETSPSRLFQVYDWICLHTEGMKRRDKLSIALGGISSVTYKALEDHQPFRPSERTREKLNRGLNSVVRGVLINQIPLKSSTIFLPDDPQQVPLHYCYASHTDLGVWILHSSAKVPQYDMLEFAALTLSDYMHYMPNAPYDELRSTFIEEMSSKYISRDPSDANVPLWDLIHDQLQDIPKPLITYSNWKNSIHTRNQTTGLWEKWTETSSGLGPVLMKPLNLERATFVNPFHNPTKPEKMPVKIHLNMLCRVCGVREVDPSLTGAAAGKLCLKCVKALQEKPEKPEKPVKIGPLDYLKNRFRFATKLQSATGISYSISCEIMRGEHTLINKLLSAFPNIPRHESKEDYRLTFEVVEKDKYRVTLKIPGGRSVSKISTEIPTLKTLLNLPQFNHELTMEEVYDLLSYLAGLEK